MRIGKEVPRRSKPRKMVRSITGSWILFLFIFSSIPLSSGGNDGITVRSMIQSGGLTLDMNESEASVGYFRDEKQSDFSGRSVSGAGDVNGDGFDEILIGASDNSAGGANAGQTYLLSRIGESEPFEVLDIVVKNGLGDEVKAADILELVQVEVVGIDSNATGIDMARVNVSFSLSDPPMITITLTETGDNTGIYTGNFIVPERAIYFERMRFSAYIDQNKYHDVVVDYPYRPASISSIGSFKDPSCQKICEKADLLDIIYFEERGIDSNNLKVDKAFVNIGSDKNSTLHQMLILIETGTQSGIYRCSYQLPNTMQYFENITIVSVEDPYETATFMVHTPVMIKSLDFSNETYEDQLYTATFYNFGYGNVIWSGKLSMAYWLSWDSTEKTLAGTPSNLNVGEYMVSISAKDSEGHSDTLELTIKVINVLPKITTENILSVKEGGEYSVDYNCDDDFQGNITWYLTTEAPWLDMDQATGELTGTPADYDVGVIPVEVIVDDGNDGRNWTRFNLTVENINQKPVIITEDILSIDQNTPFRRDYDAIDPDVGDVLSWTLQTTASWLILDAETGVLSGTPGPPDNGIVNVNVTVTDSAGSSDSHVFDLNVVDVKDKPTWIDLPPKIVEIKNGLEFWFDVNATDYDGDALTFSVVTDPKTDLKINPDTGIMTWIASIRSLKIGSDLAVTVSATDGALTSSYSFTIHILITEPPVVSLIVPADKARTPSKFTILSWNGSDPEEEKITYDLFLSDSETDVMGRNANCRVKDLEDSMYNASGLKEGFSYYWIVIPNDGGSDGTCPGGMRSFRVNSPPTFTKLSDVSATTGKNFRLKVKVTDGDSEDNDNLRFDLTKYPGGMSIDQTTGVITWTPTDDQAGYRSVTVTVMDGIETITYSFSIDVKQGKGASLPIVPIFGGIVLLIIIVGSVLIYLLRKKDTSKEEEERKDEIPDETAQIIADMEKHKQGETAMALHAPEVVKTAVPMSVAEAHANLGKDRPKTYEEMYGSPAPKEEEALTTEELKEEIGRMADELEKIDENPPKTRDKP